MSMSAAVLPQAPTTPASSVNRCASYRPFAKDKYRADPMLFSAQCYEDFKPVNRVPSASKTIKTTRTIR